jgi:hypothetical protein
MAKRIGPRRLSQPADIDGAVQPGGQRHQLSEDAELRKRRRTGAILVWNDRETEVASLNAVEGL